MSVTTRYRNAWEGFWQEAPDEPGGVIWDADASRTAARHVALFEPHVPAAPGPPRASPAGPRSPHPDPPPPRPP
ncbi:hypothetical protein ACFV4G_01330, partial [Kitasatospora sp. NPDC059747]